MRNAGELEHTELWRSADGYPSNSYSCKPFNIYFCSHETACNILAQRLIWSGVLSHNHFSKSEWSLLDLYKTIPTSKTPKAH